MEALPDVPDHAARDAAIAALACIQAAARCALDADLPLKFAVRTNGFRSGRDAISAARRDYLVNCHQIEFSK